MLAGHQTVNKSINLQTYLSLYAKTFFSKEILVKALHYFSKKSWNLFFNISPEYSRMKTQQKSCI